MGFEKEKSREYNEGLQKDKSMESQESSRITYMTATPGKRMIFQCGVACISIALGCLVVAFITPYWIISWPRVYTPFKKMGLWEVCFAGMILPTDPAQISYHGCWWILSPMYENIRGFLMPEWVGYCQIITTVCFFLEIANVILHGWLWCRTSGEEALKDSKYLFKIQTGTVLTVISGVLMVTVVLTWAIGWNYDRMWLPNPQFNYLYGSYGMAVISAFFSIFGSICLITYVAIVRQEMREPPRSVPLAGFMPSSSKADMSFSL